MRGCQQRGFWLSVKITSSNSAQRRIIRQSVLTYAPVSAEGWACQYWHHSTASHQTHWPRRRYTAPVRLQQQACRSSTAPPWRHHQSPAQVCRSSALTPVHVSSYLEHITRHWHTLVITQFTPSLPDLTHTATVAIFYLTGHFLCPPPLIGGGIKRRCCMTSGVCLSVVYIGPKSRTEKPRKIEIGTEVTHVTLDSDTTFEVNRSKVKVTRQRYSPRP